MPPRAVNPRLCPEPPPRERVPDRPGELIDVVRKTDFSFDGRANSTQVITLAEGVDVSAYTSITMMTRLHEKNLWRTSGGMPTSAVARVQIQSTYLDPDDPDVSFVDSRATQSDSITDATVVPFLSVVEHTFDAGALLLVTLRFSQLSLEAGSVQTMAISVELCGRRGWGG